MKKMGKERKRKMGKGISTPKDIFAFIRYLFMVMLSFCGVLAVCIVRFVLLLETGDEIAWVQMLTVFFALCLLAPFFISKSKRAQRMCACFFTLFSLCISLSWVFIDTLAVTTKTATYYYYAYTTSYYLVEYYFGIGSVVFIAVNGFLFVLTVLMTAIDDRRDWKPEKKDPTPEEAYERLRKLKKFAEEGFITQEDYDAKSAEIVKYL